MKNVHLIATDKPSRLYLNSENKICITDIEMKSGNNQHIYITDNSEIKEGVDQWYLDKVLNKPYNSGGAQYSSKQDVIIMTTDQDLIKDGIQAIDDEFLEWFVNNSSCEFVEVEHNYIDWVIDNYKIIIPSDEDKHTCRYSKEFNQPHPRLCTICGKKEEPNIINQWLEKNDNSEIDKQVKEEAEQLCKQETLEEAAEKHFRSCWKSFNEIDYLNFGAKWQKKQYTLEDQQIGHTIDKIKEYIKGFNEGSAYYIKRMYSEEEVIAFGEFIFKHSLLTHTRGVKSLFEQFKNK